MVTLYSSIVFVYTTTTNTLMIYYTYVTVKLSESIFIDQWLVVRVDNKLMTKHLVSQWWLQVRNTLMSDDYHYP